MNRRLGADRASVAVARWRQPGAYAAWLTRKRVGAGAAILLALQPAGFLFIVAGTHGWIVPLARPTTSDFVSFYAAGAIPARLKLAGGRRKIVLKRLAANYLPRGIVERQKHGFAVPIGALIRTLLRERCADLLLLRTNPVAHCCGPTRWRNGSSARRSSGCSTNTMPAGTITARSCGRSPCCSGWRSPALRRRPPNRARQRRRGEGDRGRTRGRA